MTTGISQPPPPYVDPAASVVAKAANDTLDATDFGKNLTNTGASGTIVLTLPAVDTEGVAGMSTRIQITAAQIVRLTPPSGKKVYLGGDGVADKYCQIAGVIGNYAILTCDGDQYKIVEYSGVLTKEA